MVRGSVKTHTAVMTGPFCLQEENMFTDDEKDYIRNYDEFMKMVRNEEETSYENSIC